ncbi:MAG: AMP-binding protein [Candidatus Binatia bacterium]
MTAIGFSNDDLEQSIPSRFEAIVRAHADRIAVKTRTRSLTFLELNRSANRAAQAILAGCNAEVRSIGLLLDHGAAAIASIFGALKAGKIYVPLDPSLPSERLGLILKDAEAGLLLTDNKNSVVARQIAGEAVRLLNVDELPASFSAVDSSDSIEPEAFACILYTSGSTGEPKGVIQNHRNLLHQSMVIGNAIHVSVEDRATLLASLSSAQAADDMYTALLNGAGLYPLNIKEEGLAHLKDWLRTESITIYRSSASVFRYFVEALSPDESFPQLRVVRLGSEPVSRNDLQLWRNRFSPECVLVNTLSSTETGTIRMYIGGGSTRVEGSSIPVGYAVPDVAVALIADDGAEAPPAGVGEITVKSRYLSPGYWRRPELTRASFLVDPRGSADRSYRTGDLGRMASDGCLTILGRKDSREKVRGYRIEIGAVEAALAEHPNVRDCAVRTVDGELGEKRLIAYLSIRNRPSPSTSELHRFLRIKLPDYMVPSLFITLDALPLTPTGKVDRRALPDPDTVRPELDSELVIPRNPVEEKLASIWSEVLSLDRIGVHDKFAELGGDSLQATRIVSRVLRSFQLQVPLGSLLESATIADMAGMITRHRKGASESEDLVQALKEIEALSEAEARLLVSGDERGIRPDLGKDSLRFWDEVAPDYTTAFSDVPEIARYVEKTERRHVFNVVKVDPSMAILDLGCGFGRWAVEFAKRCRRVVAVDFSPNMVERAHQSSREHGLHNVEFHVTPIQEFRTPEKFDIVMLSGVLVGVADDQLLEVLTNAREHLKPGGRIIVREIVGITERQKVRNELPGKPGFVHYSFYRLADEYIAAFSRIGMEPFYHSDMAPMNFSQAFYDRLVPRSRRQSLVLRGILSLGLSLQSAINRALLRHEWVYRSILNRLYRRKTVLFVFE